MLLVKIIIKGKSVKSWRGVKPSVGDSILLEGFSEQTVKEVVFDLNYEEVLVYVEAK